MHLIHECLWRNSNFWTFIQEALASRDAWRTTWKWNEGEEKKAKGFYSLISSLHCRLLVFKVPWCSLSVFEESFIIGRVNFATEPFQLSNMPNDISCKIVNIIFTFYKHCILIPGDQDVCLCHPHLSHLLVALSLLLSLLLPQPPGLKLSHSSPINFTYIQKARVPWVQTPWFFLGFSAKF